MRQTEQIWSQPLLVRVSRVADGVAYLQEHSSLAKNVESKGGLSLGEAICHGPWALLYIIVMGRLIMKGPDESLPRPFLSIVFAMSTLRDEAMFSFGDKEQAYLLLAMKEMDSLSSVILGCDMNLCRRSINLGPSTLTSWGLGVGKENQHK